MAESLGSRIKALRKTRGLTLTVVAEQTGLSVGFLSNLERDETSPSIANLHKVCAALGVTINDLLTPPAQRCAAVVRAASRPLIFEQGEGALSYSAMTAGDTSLKATCMRLNTGEWVHYAPHDHDELGIVASGSMEMHLADEDLLLSAGDSVFIPAGTMHSARRSGEQPCESYWIKAV
ncbi:MAG: helix-turn-helix domain-containing protein [Coriobacteriales bacterium]